MTKAFALILIVFVSISCRDERSSEGSIPITETQENFESSSDTLNNLLRVENPMPDQLITSPFVITGEARGYWFFEAESTAELLDGNLIRIAESNTTAIGEWMTEDWVQFAGTIKFEKPLTDRGFLILHKANASGLKKHEISDTIPVKFQN